MLLVLEVAILDVKTRSSGEVAGSPNLWTP